MAIVLVVLGALLAAAAAFHHFKAKRILAAPFVGTGAVAAHTSADPKAILSTEGAVRGISPLLSPCTETPCLYYEVEIVRHAKKTEVTQDGTKTSKSSNTVDTLKDGVVFSLDDGSGPVQVDARQGGDFDPFKAGFRETYKLEGRIPAEMQFGALRFKTPKLPSGEETTSFEAIEKIVPAEGTLFVLGSVDNGRIVKPGWRSMLLSSKGREGLVGSSHKIRKLAGIGAAALTVLAIPAAIFGEGIDAKLTAGNCPNPISALPAACHAKVFGKDGNKFPLEVTTEGKYVISVTPPANKKVPLFARVQLLQHDVAVLDLSGFADQAVTVKRYLMPGRYDIVVRDAGDLKVRGGFDFDLAVSKLEDPKPALLPVAAAPKAVVPPPAQAASLVGPDSAPPQTVATAEPSAPVSASSGSKHLRKHPHRRAH